MDRLPLELLARIFEDLQSSLSWTWSDVRNDMIAWRGQATWVRVTLVCRHWRLIAVRSPQLWTVILVDSRRWASSLSPYLERSQKMALSVSLRLAMADAEPILSILLPHAGRIRQLQVQARVVPLLATFAGRLDGLEEADLTNQGLNETYPALHFCRDDFPRLRKLVLRLVDVAWDSFSLTSLHELSIMCFAPSTTSLLHIMRISPGLHILTLSFVANLLPATGGLQDTTNIISLPHLQRIQLTGALEDVTYVLDRFTVPSGKFTIRVNYAGRHVRPMEVLLSRQLAFYSLLPHCTTVSLVAFDTASVTAFDPHGAHSLALESLEAFPINQPQAPVFTEASWMSILDAFSPAPLSRFRLEYHFPPDITPAMWSALFGHFSLAAVEARFYGTRDARGRTLLPGLDNMCAALRDPGAHGVRSLGLHCLVLNPSTAGAIFGLLEDRASVGVPLETLDLVHCFCEDSVGPQELTSKLKSHTGLVVSIR